MAADVIQADYQQLETVAARFAQHAQQTVDVEQRLRNAFDPLRQGGWMGKGSASFFAEFEGEVTPALQRLTAALEDARAVTQEIAAKLRAAETEAAALFGGGVDGMPPNGVGPDGTAANSPAQRSILADLGLAALKTSWQLFKDRNAWRGLFQGVRFAKDANGMWRLFGSRAAKEAFGVSPFLNRFGTRAVAENLRHFSPMTPLRGIVTRSGPFQQQAGSLLRNLTTSPPLQTAATFGQRIKGPAIVSSLVTTASNIYEFGWGSKRDAGFGREFFTSTGADLVAGGGIIAASTAIGTLIPIPGVGTAAGFVVGTGLQYAYDRWGKEAWRGAVDSASQWVGEQASRMPERISQASGAIGRAAQDVAGAVGNRVNQIGSAVSGMGQTIGGAFRGAGNFVGGLFG